MLNKRHNQTNSFSNQKLSCVKRHGYLRGDSNSTLISATVYQKDSMYQNQKTFHAD